MNSENESESSPSRKSMEFEKQRQEIIELWNACNVPLVHRTYFFLLFKGDPTDSVYMEVELRRLSYLKNAFSLGDKIVKDGQILSQAARYSLYLFISCSFWRFLAWATFSFRQDKLLNNYSFNVGKMVNMPFYYPKYRNFTLHYTLGSFMSLAIRLVFALDDNGALT